MSDKAPLTAEQIATLESKGARRWTKGGMDRLYIDTKILGLELDYYSTGNISSASWCGKGISNADGRRIKNSKAYVDVRTGELHVRDETSQTWEYFDTPSIEDKARAFYDEAMAGASRASAGSGGPVVLHFSLEGTLAWDDVVTVHRTWDEAFDAMVGQVEAELVSRGLSFERDAEGLPEPGSPDGPYEIDGAFARVEDSVWIIYSAGRKS